MIVSTVLLLIVYLYHQLNSQQHHDISFYHSPVYHHDLDQSICVPLLELDHVYLKMQSMISEILGHDVDPKAPLSNSDLAQLLMNDSSNKVRELRDNIKEVINSDREHNKIVVHTAVSGICTRLNELEELVNSLQKPSCPSSAPTTTSRPTITCNICKNVFGDLSELDEHIRANHRSLHCNLCERTLRSQPDYNIYKNRYHSTGNTTDVSMDDAYISSQSICSICKKHFPCSGDLEDHMERDHGNIDTATSSSQSGSSHQVYHSNHVLGQPHPEIYCCYKCDLLFTAHKDLVTHVQTIHGVSTTHTCFVCESIFTSIEILETHMKAFHPEVHSFLLPSYEAPLATSSAEPIHCKFCDETFLSMVMLNRHTYAAHSGHQDTECTDCQSSVLLSPYQETRSLSNDCIVTIICDKCGIMCSSHHELEKHVKTDHCLLTSSCDLCDETFMTTTELELHLKSSHSPRSAKSLSDLSQIDQLDGNTSICSSDLSSNPARSAPYTLNKDKQISRLAKNAVIPNFEIDISSTTNVNIQCSAGFYQLVAKPVISSLLVPNLSVSGLPISCSDSVTPKLDQLKRNVNAVLHFKVGEESSQESATIHLHHTQQKVQIQGLAAPWFAENVLKNKFSVEAKNLELNIKALNDKLAAAASSQTNSIDKSSLACNHCSRQIRKSSAFCQKCRSTFHNSRAYPCLASHVCNQVSQSSLTGPSPSTVPPGPNLQVSRQAIVTRNDGPVSQSCSSRRLILHCDSQPSHSDHFTASPMSSDSSSITSVTFSSSPPYHHTTPVSSIDSSLASVQCTSMNANAMIFAPTNTTSAAASKKKSDRRDTAGKQKDPKDLEIEFLKRELNIVKVHAIKYESEIKDLKQKNQVLTDTVSILENRKQDEISSKHSTTSSSSSQPSPTSDNSRASTVLPSQTVLDACLVNKLLNLLSDLLKYQTSENNTHVASDACKCSAGHKTQPVSPPPPASIAGAPSCAPTRCTATIANSSSTASVTTKCSYTRSSSNNDSINILDEFASELSGESPGDSVTVNDSEMELDNLNGQDLTTQPSLGHH